MPGRKHRTAQLRGAERGLWNCRGLTSGPGPRVPARGPTADQVTPPLRIRAASPPSGCMRAGHTQRHRDENKENPPRPSQRCACLHQAADALSKRALLSRPRRYGRPRLKVGQTCLSSSDNATAVVIMCQKHISCLGDLVLGKASKRTAIEQPGLRVELRLELRLVLRRCAQPAACPQNADRPSREDGHRSVHHHDFRCAGRGPKEGLEGLEEARPDKQVLS